MNLTVQELLMLKQILMDLVDQSMDSSFALRIFGMAQKVDDKMKTVQQAQQKADSEDELEALGAEEVTIDAEPLSVQEVTHYMDEVSPRTLIRIESLFGND